MKKKKITIITIVIFVVGLIITGASYAFWSWNSTINKNVVFNTANNLKNYIVYNEGESAFTGELNVSNNYQTGGIHSTISIYKTTNVNLLATIHMDINQIGENMKNSSALKWVVTEGTTSNVGAVLAKGNFIGTKSGDVLTLVPDINVTTTETFYTIWIWLDSAENPSDNLSGETLDTNVWTEINQVEGSEDRYEVTNTTANYQAISATVVDSKYKVTHYAVTTTNSEPTSWTTITPETDQAKVYNLNTTVESTGTYYIWFKDESGRVTSKSVTIDAVDNSAPVCTWGTFNPTQIQNNQTAQIDLTCIDEESEVTIHNLTTNDIVPSNTNSVTVTNITKESVTNGYKYTITVTGTTNDGTSTLTSPANLVKNALNLGNASVTSGNITVANGYTAKFYYQSNNTSGSTTVTSVNASCIPSSSGGTCTATIPTVVKNSVGTYNNAYAGLSTSTSNMTEDVSASATTVTLSGDATYYSLYRSNVTIYSPSDISSCTSSQYYRNQWFTSTSAMADTVLSTSTTGTSNSSAPTVVSDYTFSKLTTASSDGGTQYTSIADAAKTNAITFYMSETKSVSVSFRYCTGTNCSSTGTVSGSGTQTLYCTSTSTAGFSNGTVNVPDDVTTSTGPNGSSYFGLSTAQNSTTITTTINTGTTQYYAVYGGDYTATFTKDNSTVSSIGSTSLSCSSRYTYNGSNYAGTDCVITLPSITPNTGYAVSGWYDSNDNLAGQPNGSKILTDNATFTAKGKQLVAREFFYSNDKTGVECHDVQCMIDYLDKGDQSNTNLKLGDYISYTPSKTSYTTDTSMTGYASTQAINPSELNLWRVISLNADGTVDIISEHVSSINVYFTGQTGYQNLVGYLNVLASQYETTGVTVGSRHFGYNGQTEYITDTTYFVNPAPWECSTGSTSSSCDPKPQDYEAYGGGDELYKSDYDLINTVLGTRIATNPSGSATLYWRASRDYYYSSSTAYYWNGRNVDTSGYNSSYSLYSYYGGSFNAFDSRAALRPIVTLKSGLSYSGAGTESNPKTIG